MDAHSRAAVLLLGRTVVNHIPKASVRVRPIHKQCVRAGPTRQQRHLGMSLRTHGFCKPEVHQEQSEKGIIIKQWAVCNYTLCQEPRSAVSSERQ
jgi:hypothetical protein